MNITDNPPPLPPGYLRVECMNKDFFDEGQVRSIEAAAFERCRVQMQKKITAMVYAVDSHTVTLLAKIDTLRKVNKNISADYREVIKERDELRAKLKAPEEQMPVARLLHWRGPAHYPIPSGGIAARTFTEFPKEEADKPGSYWKNGEPLYKATGAKE